MTLLSWLFLIPGLVILVWPFVFVLFFKTVRPVQWLYSVAALDIGIAVILYSCMFNENLKDEYILVLMYCITALFAPTLFYLFVNKLTNPDGVSFKVRIVFVIPIIASSVVVGSAMLAGRANYRAYLDQVVYNSDPSLTGVFEYDQLVIIDWYFFLFVLLAEVVWLVVTSIRKLFTYYSVLDEYMEAHGRGTMIKTNRIVLVIMGVALLYCVTVLGLFPVNELQNVGLAVSVCVINCIVSLLLGFVVSAASLTAEEMNGMIDLTDRRAGNVRWLGPKEQLAYYRELSNQMVEVVEHQKGYLDRRLSFEDMCNKLGADQLDMAEAIRLIHGSNFLEYVNSLRIDRAIAMILVQSEDDDALMLRYKVLHTDFLKSIVLDCGFENEDHFKKVFRSQMGQSLLDWIDEDVV